MNKDVNEKMKMKLFLQVHIREFYNYCGLQKIFVQFNKQHEM